MLILTRKAGESIVLDGGIRITVVQTEAGSVRLGIEAPPDVAIFREELLERMASENQRASATPGELLAFLRDAAAGPSLPAPSDSEADDAPELPSSGGSTGADSDRGAEPDPG